MIFLPIPLVIEGVVTTGSSLVDVLGMLPVIFYDFVTGAGSSVEPLSSVSSS